MSSLLQRIALVVALGALGVLGWSVWHPRSAPDASITALTLWTAGAAAPATDPTGLQRALPDASAAPAETPRVPDVAFLRRSFPKLHRIELLGDGVTASEAEALRGLDVQWTPPPVRYSAPALVALSAPRTLAVGQRLRVEGRVRGLQANGVTPLRLEGPDGGSQSVELRGDAGGEASFAIASNPVAAPGRYEWALQLHPTSPPLRIGAQVVRTELPRVLILQASPSAEAGRLQRWLADAGAPVTSRIRVSAEHVRFAAANNSPEQFARVEPELLKHFDVVVTGEAAIQELTGEERTALRDAVLSRGLGLLVTGEGASPGPSDDLAPWQLKPDATIAGGEDTRVARLRLADGTELGEPITLLASGLTSVPLERWLARDAQDRAACVALPRGHGWIGRSLVVDTWRWLQGGHPEAFAAYWSELLTALATPASTGRWHLAAGEDPIFAQAPVRFAWMGSAEAGPPRTKIKTASGHEADVSLTRDSADPARFLGLVHPTESGWHDVQATGGTSFGFYVYAADALPELRAETRHAVTARLLSATDRKADATGESTPPGTIPWLNLLAFAFFIAGAAVLFVYRRE